jgi:hypothetical protein
MFLTVANPTNGTTFVVVPTLFTWSMYPPMEVHSGLSHGNAARRLRFFSSPLAIGPGRTTAVADHLGSNALLDRGLAERIRQNIEVRMRMGVYESRGYNPARRIDDGLGVSLKTSPDLDDLAAGDGNVSFEPGIAGSVDNVTVLDQYVVHSVIPPLVPTFTMQAITVP